MVIILKLSKRILTIFILGGLISPLTSINAHQSPALKKFIQKLEVAGDGVIGAAAGSLATFGATAALRSFFGSIEAAPADAIQIIEATAVDDLPTAIEGASALTAEVCVMGGCD